MNLTHENRNDLVNIFNRSRFYLRHYAKGTYPYRKREYMSMPVNRLFFPLCNPNGDDNLIADHHHSYTMVPGRFYFVPAYLPVIFLLDDKLEFLSVHTNLFIFPGVELFSGCHRMLELPQPPEFQELLELFSTSDNNFITAAKTGGLAFSITARLLSMYSEEEFQEPLSLKQYMHLTDYLVKHGDAQTSVSEIASICGESRECFTRHFKARTGITPKQFIDRVITGRCLELLQNGRSSKEISSLMNFSSEYVFSRYFKRNLNESPRHWMQKKLL
ncbi:MAG: helix-turn-helix transcriptional regulator [Victivallales bacterium]|nr:helix-turn-helix transcriptional regulator [Victivallales bacterium]